jgi:hypothetical protein
MWDLLWVFSQYFGFLYQFSFHQLLTFINIPVISVIK